MARSTTEKKKKKKHHKKDKKKKSKKKIEKSDGSGSGSGSVSSDEGSAPTNKRKLEGGVKQESKKPKSTMDIFKLVEAQEKSKPIVGTVHASEKKEEYIKIGNAQFSTYVKKPTKEEIDEQRSYWECNCGNRNFRRDIECSSCRAIKRS